MPKKLTYEEVRKKLENKNLTMLITEKEYNENYNYSKAKIPVTNGVYKAMIVHNNYCKNGKNEPRWFYNKNPFIIYNLNQYLNTVNNKQIICISTPEEYTSRDALLNFKCCRCGKEIKLSSFNAMRTDKFDQHKGIRCSNCDGTIESLHASVLKQIYKHEYPNTILEEQSCINPKTNKIMATDIVNHEQKIAIEVQGQWHNLESQKERDQIKKDFWINKGYTFYDYSIDNISILDYVRLFFPDIKEIPSWVDMNFANKLNISKCQKLLDENYTIPEISQKLDVNVHRIYDAIYSKKLHYPKGYSKSCKRVVQLSKNKEYIRTYDSYREAEKENGMAQGLISSCIYYKNYYSKGYYWIPEKEYLNN